MTGIQFTTALEQLTTTGATAGNQNILSIQPDQHGGSIITTVSSMGFTNGGQQTLHHVDPSSISFHHQQPVVTVSSQPQPHELLQQPGGGSISHSNTVIIQQPLMEDIVTTTTTATNQQSGTTVTTLLESQGAGGQFDHHQLHVHLDQSQQQQLVSMAAADGHGGQTAAGLHQMVHHVLVDPSTVDHHTGTGGHYQLAPGAPGRGDGGVASPVIQSDPVAQYSSAGATASLGPGEADGGVVFSLQGIPTSSTYS